MLQADNKTEKSLHEILMETYDGNENAVAAAEYFVAFYNQWEEMSKSLESKQSQTLDRFVCMVLNGEAHTTTSLAKALALELHAKGKLMEFTMFLTSLMSGEILANPFVAENREKVGAAVLNDVLNETAKRALGGKIAEAAEINKWNIISAIAAIVGGTDKAIQININLKGAFSHGSGSGNQSS